VSFAGVLLIVRPGGQVFGWPTLFPLATAFCFAGYQLLTRKLAGIDDGPSTLFLGALVATALATLVVPWYWAPPRNGTGAGPLPAVPGRACGHRAGLAGGAVVLGPAPHLDRRRPLPGHGRDGRVQPPAAGARFRARAGLASRALHLPADRGGADPGLAGLREL